jgi:hypothetical protein
VLDVVRSSQQRLHDIAIHTQEKGTQVLYPATFSLVDVDTERGLLDAIGDHCGIPNLAKPFKELSLQLPHNDSEPLVERPAGWIHEVEFWRPFHGSSLKTRKNNLCYVSVIRLFRDL